MHTLETIQTELQSKLDNHTGSWIDYLEDSYDLSMKGKDYHKCYLLNELIGKELQKLY